MSNEAQFGLLEFKCINFHDQKQSFINGPDLHIFSLWGCEVEYLSKDVKILNTKVSYSTKSWCRQSNQATK